MNLRQVSSFMRKIPILLRLTLWLLLVVPFASIRAQSIDPMNEAVAVHVHPQDDIVGVTNGIVFATYTLDFQFIEEFTLLGDPSIQPIQYNFHWSPNGNKLAVLLYGVSVPPVDTVLQIWDITTPQKLYEIPGADLFVGVAWSPDGTRFASLIRNDELQTFVQVYSAITGQMLVEIPSPSITQLAWSPSGNQLVFETIADVKIYSADTGQLLRTLNAKMDSELELAFSPTQNLAAFVNLNTGDNVIEIWNTDTGQFVRQLSGHTKRIIHFEWTTGGLVSTGFDDTIRIWDPQTGQQIRSFQMGRYPYAQLNANGTVLLVQDQATGIHTRDAETGAILAVFGETVNNGPIVYSSKQTGTWELYTVNADGTNETRLTYGGYNRYPSWSPDGTKIAFYSRRDDYDGEIYSMNADGSNVVRLTAHAGYDSEPDWSPDGSRIVFSSRRSGTDDELWLMNADGSGQTLLYDSAGDDFEAAWSPDSAHIAFRSNQSGNHDVYRIPVSGGTPTNLTTHAQLDALPAWSPDGSLIAFVTDRVSGGSFEIFRVPAAGGTAENVSSLPAYDSHPAWSPDGALLAFISNRDGDNEVWTMTAAGATPVQLTVNTAVEWDPDWVALTAGGQALLSAPVIPGEPIPDNTPQPDRLNPLPVGKHEENHPDLFYAGVWRDEDLTEASAGTLRTSRHDGGQVQFAFEGTEIVLHFLARPDALPIEVCIDEVCQTLDLYSIQSSLTSITIGDLQPGVHTVRISNDSAGYLSLDAIEVPEK